jgi:predicted glycoside hydrolase/deacetylase ChbG (UPF0249 family)
MKLILHADDLGFSPTVNQTIFELYNLGRLTSTSLVVNMGGSQPALDALQDYPNLRVGIHLNLTKGEPISSSAQIPSLLNRNERFYLAVLFYPLAVARGISPTEAEIECRSQIELALKAGLQPSHLDSHNHFHMLRGFKDLVQKLAGEYNIPHVRPTNPRYALLPSRIWLWAALSKKSPKYYILALDDWMNLTGKPRRLFFSKTLRIILDQPDVTLELVLHPGRAVDPEFPPDTISPKRREWDYNFARSLEFDSWLETVNGEIISFRDADERPHRN